MTTIKSYTDINQSRKLAEILPIESADMFHFIHEVDTVGFGYKKDAEEFYSKTEFEYIPCWSLAALLNILPPYLFEFERGIDLNVYPNLNSKGWHCSYIPNCVENMKIDKFKLITSGDNLVDACIAMIETLHEIKML